MQSVFPGPLNRITASAVAAWHNTDITALYWIYNQALAQASKTFGPSKQDYDQARAIKLEEQSFISVVTLQRQAVDSVP